MTVRTSARTFASRRDSGGIFGCAISKIGAEEVSVSSYLGNYLERQSMLAARTGPESMGGTHPIEPSRLESQQSLTRGANKINQDMPAL